LHGRKLQQWGFLLTLRLTDYLAHRKGNEMKSKVHRFEIVVRGRLYESNITRRDAERALLACHAKRAPDFCEFIILRKAPKKAK
jgi:hypothetical protein